jgi:hypothetical protein
MHKDVFEFPLAKTCLPDTNRVYAPDSVTRGCGLPNPGLFVASLLRPRSKHGGCGMPPQCAHCARERDLNSAEDLLESAQIRNEGLRIYHARVKRQATGVLAIANPEKIAIWGSQFR